MTLEDRIHRYLDGGLNEAQVAELDALLRDSAEARKTYWEIAGTHVLLDRVHEEQSGAEWAEPVPVKKATFRWLPAVAAAAVAIVATWWVVNWQSEPTAVIVATAHGGSEVLEKGPLSLKSGVTKEITFLKGTRVALEGPLEIELISDERMKLVRGKIGVEVPDGAEGFTVETPDGEVIDYGTRFGLSVGEDGDMRAEVFQGRIDVVIGEKTHRMEGRKSLEVSGSSQSVFPGSDSSSFPMPSLKEVWKVGGSYSGQKSFAGGRPKVPNQWSGDLIGISKGLGEISPRSAGGMLHFQGTSAQKEVRNTNASQLWRIVDLYEVREKMGRRPERVSLSGWVNRVTGDSQTDRAFLFGLSCHHEITQELDESENVTTKVMTSLISDSDPGTWERADLQLHLPQNLRYLVIMIGASEDVSNNEEGPEFDGHFLDDLNLVFRAGMRPSVAMHYWRGSEGYWENPGKWSENRIPSLDSYTVVQGSGRVTVGGNIAQGSGSLVVALDNNSSGSIYLPPLSALNLGSTETILGFNRGAEAHAHISGKLSTDGRLFIGRNNAQSSLVISGSIVSSSIIQLSQYDSPEETRSELVVAGGSLQAQALKLIHDQSSVTLRGGSITVDELHLGGDNGEAVITVARGELKVKEFFLGGGDGKANFVQSGGIVRVEKLHRNTGSYEMPNSRAQLWIKMPAAEIADFLPDVPRSTRGDWTVISHAQ